VILRAVRNELIDQQIKLRYAAIFTVKLRHRIWQELEFTA
jgi:hypothetical protein